MNHRKNKPQHQSNRKSSWVYSVALVRKDYPAHTHVGCPQGDFFFNPSIEAWIRKLAIKLAGGAMSFTGGFLNFWGCGVDQSANRACAQAKETDLARQDTGRSNPLRLGKLRILAIPSFQKGSL